MEISSELAKQLLEAAPDPCIVIDAQGTVRYVNSRVTDVLGYSAAELIDEPIEILLPEPLRALHATHRARYFAAPHPRPMGSGLELHALSSDGREIPVEISLSPVTTAEGRLVCAAIRDVSAHKALERQLIEANRAKSRFLAAASHDLRQPIQALNLLNATARKVAGGAVHQSIIEKQQKSLDSISRLLNSLLDISKLESGIVKPDITDFAVHEIFEELRAEFEEQAKAKGLDLIVDSCQDVARSDPGLLSQILENLVANALRYTREGFVRLRCIHEALAIRLEVLDTGLGISSDQLDKIFGEFYQVDRGAERPEGLGLGLSIVKRTAELLGHPLEIDSKPGLGSVFAITVPRGDDSSLPATATDEAYSLGDRSGLILVVDDDAAIADATRMLLELEGYEVLTAACGREAIERLSGRTPDLLITDYHLRNEETGIDVIHSVRDRFGSNIPAILVSGDTSHAIALNGLESAGFLTKPTETDALLAEIDRQRCNTQ